MLEVRTLVTIWSLFDAPSLLIPQFVLRFHLEKGSHQKQTLMGRPGEGVLHTNIRIVNLSQSFGTDFF